MLLYQPCHHHPRWSIALVDYHVSVILHEMGLFMLCKKGHVILTVTCRNNREIIIQLGKRQMAIRNAYRQVAWRARPSHINNSGSGNPTSSSVTHPHTQQRSGEDRDASPPHLQAERDPSRPCCPLPPPPPPPPRRFRAIRGSPPHLPFPAPDASRPPVAARRRPPWPPIPPKVPASSLALPSVALVRFVPC